MQNIDIVQILKNIKRNRWKQFKKEIMEAICGVIIYHTWRARNWRRFRDICVHAEDAVTQIKKKISERLHLLSGSKKASKCRHFIHHLLCN